MALQPHLGPVTSAQRQPPAISGGTLLVLRDGKHAVAADPDRDAVYVIDLGQGTSQAIALTQGDEPGRLAQDGAGRVHVALRSGGALVTIDPGTATITDRRAVCPAPRGVAWESSSDLVWVACATGELVALPAAGGGATHTFVVERDLRDVIDTGNGIAVSQFRSAQVLLLGPDGSIVQRSTLPNRTIQFAPHVAWRTVAGPSGTFVAVHQEEAVLAVGTTVRGGYGGAGGGGSSSGCSGGSDSGGPGPTGFVDSGAPPGPPPFEAGVGGDAFVPFQAPPPPAIVGQSGPPGFCNGAPLGQSPPFPLGGELSFVPMQPQCPPSPIVHSVLSVIDAQGQFLVNETIDGTLPVDVAVSPDGTSVAVAAPGNAFLMGLPTVFRFSLCRPGTEFAVGVGEGSAQPVAVAFDPSGNVVVQTREPAAIWIIDPAGGLAHASISLSNSSVRDTGHDIFHTQAGGMIACASCHPEGRDDGHVWMLDDNPRRTPSLAGTIAGTAPYHWPGDKRDMPALVNDVYTVRMNGALLAVGEMDALSQWVQGRPSLPAPSWVDPGAVARGKALFGKTTTACATCHSGSKFTNNQTVDVGTGGAFQVPPLVGVGWRTPLLHDGRASTIADRLGAASTMGHGNLSGLSTSQIADLATYLESL